jgi:hypothetical protein
VHRGGRSEHRRGFSGERATRPLGAEPSAGTAAAGAATTGATFGTVRTRARMPSTLSMPRAIDCASERTEPVAL